MDADTRHQLKQNELAEFLGRLRDLNDPRFRYTIAVVVVAVIAIAAWQLVKFQQRHAQEESWRRLTDLAVATGTTDPTELATATDGLRAFVQETSDPALAGYARLQLARLRYDQAFNDPQQRPAGFEEAAALLEEITGTPGMPPKVAAAALFLLATTHESLGQADAAATLYERLASEEQYSGAGFAKVVDERLEDIDELRTPIVFEPGDPPSAVQPLTPATPGSIDFSDLLRRGEPPDEIRRALEAQMAQMQRESAGPVFPVEAAEPDAAQPDEPAGEEPAPAPEEPRPQPAPETPPANSDNPNAGTTNSP